MRSMIDRKGMRKQELLKQWNRVVREMKRDGGKMSVAKAAFMMGYTSLKSFRYYVLPILLEVTPSVEFDPKEGVLRYVGDET